MISFHCEFASPLYYQKLAKNIVMNDKERPNRAAEATLRERLGVKQDLQKAVGNALSMKLHAKQLTSELVLKELKTYEKDMLTMEQKFVTLSEMVVDNKQTQN